MSLKNKKILVVSSKFPEEYSGSGLRAYNTYKRLEEKYDIKWDVLANSIAFQGNATYEYEGKSVYRISSPFKMNFKNKLLRIISILFSMLWESVFVLIFLFRNGNQYHMLHSFGNTWSIGILTLYFFYKRKPIIRELVTDMKNPFFPIQIDFLIKRVFLKSRSLVVAISKKLEIVSKNNCIKNIWQRPNPIDENKFFVDYSQKFKYRKVNTKFSEKDVVLCYVGSLRNSKNHIFLLDMLTLLPINFKLVIAGPENKNELDISNKLESRIIKLGINDRVQFEKRFVNNIDEYIKMSDVYLFPSKSEGLGTPILEAQACGVPVVSNLLKNITDSEIIEGEGGYCSSLKPEEFARKIEKSLEISRDTLIKNAQHIRQRASTEFIDEEYYKKIDELING